MKPRFFGVAPPHTRGFGVGEVLGSAEYRRCLRDHVAGAAGAGLEGMVLYNFSHALDPWAVAAEVLAAAGDLDPIVSVQAHHEHPFAVARRAAGLSYLFGRAVHVNAVAGASAREREALGLRDRAAGKRRLHEFVAVLDRFRDGAVSFAGEFYDLEEAVIEPASRHRPTIFVPGSIGEDGTSDVPPGTDCCLVMAKPREELRVELARLVARGARVAAIVGVLAREAGDEAGEEAQAAFATGRREEMSARVQMRDSVSSQHVRNYELRESGEMQDEILWYGSARHGIDCPKLVGSYAEVAAALERYLEIGVTDFIVDLPHDVAEYEHVGRVVQRVRGRQGALRPDAA